MRTIIAALQVSLDVPEILAEPDRLSRLDLSAIKP